MLYYRHPLPALEKGNWLLSKEVTFKTQNPWVFLTYEKLKCERLYIIFSRPFKEQRCIESGWEITSKRQFTGSYSGLPGHGLWLEPWKSTRQPSFRGILGSWRGEKSKSQDGRKFLEDKKIKSDSGIRKTISTNNKTLRLWLFKRCAFSKLGEGGTCL